MVACQRRWWITCPGLIGLFVYDELLSGPPPQVVIMRARVSAWKRFIRWSMLALIRLLLDDFSGCRLRCVFVSWQAIFWGITRCWMFCGRLAIKWPKSDPGRGYEGEIYIQHRFMRTRTHSVVCPKMTKIKRLGWINYLLATLVQNTFVFFWSDSLKSCG